MGIKFRIGIFLQKKAPGATGSPTMVGLAEIWSCMFVCASLFVESLWISQAAEEQTSPFMVALWEELSRIQPICQPYIAYYC